MASRLSSPQRRTSPSPVCRGRQTKVSLLKQPPASHRAIGKYEHQVQALLSLKQDQLEPVNGISPSSNNWPFEGVSRADVLRYCGYSACSQPSSKRLTYDFSTVHTACHLQPHHLTTVPVRSPPITLQPKAAAHHHGLSTCRSTIKQLSRNTIPNQRFHFRQTRISRSICF